MDDLSSEYGRFRNQSRQASNTNDAYPYSGLHKLLPFVILDICWRSNPLVNEVGQRLCLDPLSEELRAIVENIEIYVQPVSEVDDDSGHSLPQRMSAIRGSMIG